MCRLFHFLFRERIHESVAVSALIAVSAALHAMWMAHLFIFRAPSFAKYFLLNESVGIVFGLYLFGLLVFIVSGLVSLLYWRGRDCQSVRDRIFWFFVVTLIMYVLLTFPPIYGFEILMKAV